MKYRKLDILYSELIVLFTSSLLTTILIGFIAVFQLPKIIIVIVWLGLFAGLNYILIASPTKILLAGHLQLRTQPSLEVYIAKFLAKYIKQSGTETVHIHVIEDTGYAVLYYADIRSLHLVFSSKLVEDWNEIDVESALLYLFDLLNHTFPLRDTCVLVLATIAERFIITSFVGASLVHMVRAHTDDERIDRRAIGRIRYAMGYQAMLSKLKSGSTAPCRLPKSFGMNAVGDITGKGVDASLYSIHETLDNRIEAIVGSSPDSQTPGIGNHTQLSVD